MRDFISAIFFRLTLLGYTAGIGAAICGIWGGLLCNVVGWCPVGPNPLWLVWVSVALFVVSIVFRILADKV
jgi:hypothetical protein